jgi:inner membrane protein
MADLHASFNDWLTQSQFARMLLIGFLLLLLQIPIVLMHGLVQEREKTRQEAVEDITGKWGRTQTVIGPVIEVPYVNRWTEEAETGERIRHAARRRAFFLPETLDITGQIETENRYRGIFEVPVDRMQVELEGHFERPTLAEWGVAPEDVLWDRAQLHVLISDLRAIQNQAVASWNGDELTFVSGAGQFGNSTSGIHVPLRGKLEGATSQFGFTLDLNGSRGAFFAPLGKKTEVSITSDWSDPSFQGNWLPTSRTVSGEGFEAGWQIPSLGRNYPQSWGAGEVSLETLEASRFGVKFITPVDHYRMAQRSLKYEILFLFLTFLFLWLFEVLAKVRIHWIQYLLVGAALCLFYLLELSLSEQLGFVAAYTLASAAVVGLITTYSLAVLKRVGRAALLGFAVAILYTYLFVLLNNQDYALLVGSIGLFSILAAVMYLTRRIDWYNLRS